MEKFARRCDATGRGMNDGYVVGDGEMYLSTTDLLLSHLRHLDYLDSNNVLSSTIKDDQELMDFFYNDDYYYYTEWEEIDEDLYYDEDGNEYEL